MKKFYAFLAAALMSVSVFAAKDVVPSDAVLAEYYEPGQVCVCIYVPGDMACYDVVLVGSFHADENKNWLTTPVSDLPKFEAVEGYDGWYVVSYTPEAEPDTEKGMQAKPVMLDADGNFNWEYQIGAATAIRGGVTVSKGLYEGEIDLINYGTDAPNVFTVDAWKQNPCTAVYHNYTITVINDGCNGLTIPFIVGGMNTWTFQQMQLDVTKTQELGAPVYYYSFKGAEGTPYQIVSAGMDPETGLVDSTAAPGWVDEAYLQVLVDGVWGRYQPGNSFTGEEANIVYDLRVDTMRWARCVNEPAESTVARVKLPTLNAPDSVEIIGGFDGWNGTVMELIDGWYVAEFKAKASQFFKFRSKGAWPSDGGTEIEVYNEENDEWKTIQDNQYVFGQLWEGEEGNRTIELDLSDAAKYRWIVAEQDIENVVLTEKAQKVMIDGVMYIIRDNKMFNVQGTQVR